MRTTDTYSVQSVQLLSRVWLFVTPWTVACQASLSIAPTPGACSELAIESVMPSNHLILYLPLLLLPSIFPSSKVFSNELALCTRWPNYWSFSFRIIPSSEYSGWQEARLPCPWGFSRQEYCSGLPCPPPGDLPNPGRKHRFSTLQSDSLPSEPEESPISFRTDRFYLLASLTTPIRGM